MRPSIVETVYVAYVKVHYLFEEGSMPFSEWGEMLNSYRKNNAILLFFLLYFVKSLIHLAGEFQVSSNAKILIKYTY